MGLVVTCEHGARAIGGICAACEYDKVEERTDWQSSGLNEIAPPDDLPDWFDAAAAVLERAAARIRARVSVEDVANELLPAVRIMARRI
jgi:hypothetical protein